MSLFARPLLCCRGTSCARTTSLAGSLLRVLSLAGKNLMSGYYYNFANNKFCGRLVLPCFSIDPCGDTWRSNSTKRYSLAMACAASAPWSVSAQRRQTCPSLVPTWRWCALQALPSLVPLASNSPDVSPLCTTTTGSPQLLRQMRSEVAYACV